LLIRVARKGINRGSFAALKMTVEGREVMTVEGRDIRW
jgi:hypothetical protein